MSVFKAMRALNFRRVLISIGANDEQADEFVEAMNELPTEEDIDRMLSKQLNRILLSQMAVGGLIIGAVALLTQL